MARSDAFYKVDAAVRLLPKKSHFQFIISTADIFRTNRQTLHTVVNNISQTFSSYNDNVRFKLLIRYKFGNDKIKHVDRQTGNAEERSRINKSAR
jgi:hypothetical protein